MSGKRKITAFILGICCMVAVYAAFVPGIALAATASVMFGSDSYETESGEELPIGVHIKADDEIGYYRVEIEYDRDRMEYLGGATEESEGIIVFEGNGNGTDVSTMLRFRIVSGGETKISMKDARILVPGTDDRFELAEMAEVPISLRGEDTVTTSAETQTAETTVETETNEPETTESSGSVDSPDKKDESGFFWPAVLIGIPAAVLAGIIAILAVRSNKRKKRMERLRKARSAGEKIKNNELPEKEVKEAKEAKRARDDADHSVVHAKEFRTDGTGDGSAHEEPVIRVKNVSMSFKVSDSAASGIKDYMIQKTKGKMKKREFKALDDISFDVYKGEVVGIIGTNGSGKSTLLKIVSGAMNPTSGEVIADKSKIQLLTWGTGFDGELSAKENVYLNGAIIGYSKEFIDEHYDEIVEFAELQGFMGEKVKNFSSGMVSRLGFSIATVAGAADILILDEVLAVGDQFFRKKSLQRVKDMIHGGATVLIVSHSLGTIKAHCDRVIWIEKGHLKMAGDPKMVCEAYSKSHIENVPSREALRNCNDFKSYIYGIRKYCGKDLVIISSKDAHTYATAQNVKTDLEAVKEIGMETDLLHTYRYSVLAVIDEGKVIFEKAEECEEAVFKDNVGNTEVEANSVGFNVYESDSTPIEIKINGAEYAMNKRGLNIVIWDKEKNSLLDSVCFDIFAGGKAIRDPQDSQK